MSGPSAFPNAGNPTWDMKPELGMTLRDWFAGQALPSVIAATSAGQHQPGKGWPEDDRPLNLRMACDAYALADAMLAARGEA